MRGRKPTKRQGAEGWVWAYLSGGKRLTKEIETVGAKQGFGYRTLMRCKAALGIQSVKIGHDWYWRRPDIEEEPKAQVTLQDVIQKIEDQRSATAIAAAVSTSPTTIPPVFPQWLPYDVWTDDDYQKSSYEEILKRVLELSADLDSAKKYHGRRIGLEKADNSETISLLEPELARANEWAEKKV